MKANKKTKLNESDLRTLLRKEIKRILEADEAPDQEASAEKPEEEEEGLGEEKQTATNVFINKLKNMGGVDGTDLIEMLSSVIESFAESSEERLQILKGIKNNIVR